MSDQIKLVQEILACDRRERSLRDGRRENEHGVERDAANAPVQHRGESLGPVEPHAGGDGRVAAACGPTSPGEAGLIFSMAHKWWGEPPTNRVFVGGAGGRHSMSDDPGHIAVEPDDN